MKALIAGAGAHGRVVLDIARACGRYDRLAFVDDDLGLSGKSINGATVESGLAPALQARGDVEFLLALGHPDARMAVLRRLMEAGVRIGNAIHPSAVLMPSACVGFGLTIAAAAVVNSNARIGNGVIVNTAAVVEHDCEVEDGATVAPGVQLGGRVRIGYGAFVGTGAIVLPRVRIGERSVIAAGSIVTKDVPARVLVMGSPASIRAETGDDFDWSRVL